MYKGRKWAMPRLIMILLAGAILVAPLVSIVHSVEHHGTIDSPDCGTCQWSKQAVGTISASLSFGFFAVAEGVAEAMAIELHLAPRISSQHSRGPPTSLV